MARLAIAGALTGPVLALGIYLAHALAFRHYVNDDAYITFRYTRFLWQGLGPYFNVGERVEGYTNFLLMLLLVPVLALGGESAVPIAAKVVGVVSGALCLILPFALVRTLEGGAATERARILAGTVAMGVVAVSPSFAVNSVSGLETTLFGACVTSGVFLAALSDRRHRWYGSGLAFAAATLARPEGAVVFAVHWAVRAASRPDGPAALARLVLGPPPWRGLREDRAARRLALDAVIVVVVFLAHLAFRRWAYDGEWLPNTYYAKTGGFSGVGVWSYIVEGIVSPLGGVVGLTLAVVGLIWGGGLPRWAWPAAAVPVAGALLPLVLGADWMAGQRSLMPFLPLAAVFVAIGWCRLATRAITRPAWLGPSLPLVAVLVLWFVQSPARASLMEETLLQARGYRESHDELARWLCGEATRPGDTVALADIGRVGYRCLDRTILDITGLTDRFIAKSPGTLFHKRYDVGYILDRRPAVIVLGIGQMKQPGQATPDRLVPATEVQAALLESPAFRRWYRRVATESPGPEGWLAALARELGASKVWLHAHPRAHYVLAAFKRLDAPGP